ncbi:hypothetical protein Mycch_3035 [Mycolicibacterium chubuense NBB4]|uniref:DUF4333 domain-containing protein n=2 Tax=Mycolicibacterium chubuense TaxID=1800 RepID=I4BKI0_MYCCN|nr:hypothetical protein Mycch_3035 [Mycolicibacterium chubuense NBB4]
MRKVLGPAAALAAGAMMAALAGGCTLRSSGGLPAVAGSDLQDDISARLANAGEQPESVTCKDALIGQVGQSVRCDVVMSATNSFQPVVTVTGVNGTTIDYEMKPALSKDQLERAVARLVSDTGASAAASVTCLSDLPGTMGAVAHCDVTTAGVTLRRTAEVKSVQGLMMNFDLVPMLTKAEVESSLLDELATHLGKRPDSASCSGNLEGHTGNTVDCTVLAGAETAALTLTVTAVDGDKIDYTYAPRK